MMPGIKKPCPNRQEIGLTYLKCFFPTAMSRIQKINVEYHAPTGERACIPLVGQWKEGTNPMSGAGEQQTDEDRRELEELKRQLGTFNVAPPNFLGFGTRFAEILSRIGNPVERKRTPTKKKKKQV
jgi:hypothetical protein